MEVSSISRSLKALARELKVPVIVPVAAQPRPASSREGQPAADERPARVGLDRAGCGRGGPAAPRGLLPPAQPEWAESNPDKVNTAELIIAKQRNGPTGTVKLTWDPKTTRFKNHSGYHGDFGGGYAAGGSAYSGPSPFDTEVKPMNGPATPAPPRGGFPAGPRTGPIESHRDGGGPDREEYEGDIPV